MEPDATVPLSQYLRPLRNHLRLILAITVAVMLLGILASFLGPTSYRSTSSILVTPISSDPSRTIESNVEVAMATEERIASSTDVLQLVADEMNAQGYGVTAVELSESITVSSPRDSRILDVSYVAPTREQAQAGAAAFADTYLSYRIQVAEEDKTTATASLSERIETLQAELSDASAELARTPSTSQKYLTLEVRQQAIVSELDAQQRAFADLSTLSFEVGRVISPAELPEGSEEIGLLAVILGSLVGGLVIGGMAAFVLDAFRNEGSMVYTSAIEPFPSAPTLGRFGTDISPITLDAGSDADDGTEDDENEDDEDDISSEARRTTQLDPNVASELITGAGKNGAGNGSNGSSTGEDSSNGATEKASTNSSEGRRKGRRKNRNGVAAAKGNGSILSGDDDLAALLNSDFWEDAAADRSGGPEPKRAETEAGGSTNGDTETEIDLRDAAENNVAGKPGNKAADSSLVRELDFDALLAQIEESADGGPKSLVCLGETGWETGVAIALLLADEYHASGSEVLLVDLQIEAPSLHDLLNVPTAPGLLDVLVGEVSLDDAMNPLPTIGDLRALTVGGRMALTDRGKLDLVNGWGMRKLLSDVSSASPTTIFVGGPLSGIEHLDLVVRAADAIIIGTERHADEPVGPNVTDAVSDRLPAEALTVVSLDAAMTSKSERSSNPSGV